MIAGDKRASVYLFLLLGGIGAVFGFAPFFLAPLYLIGILILFISLDKTTKLWAAFVRGWFFAFIMLAFSMFWLGAAFLVDAAKFFWLMPFAVTALPAGLGIFWGLAAVLYVKFRPKSAFKAFYFAACFGLAEYLRGTILTGLPWNLPAYIFNAGGLISQNAAWFGPYGISLIVLFVGAAIGCFGMNRGKIILGLAIFFSIFGFGYGFFHLNFSNLSPREKSPIIATGQGGFSQKELYEFGNEGKVVSTYLDLLKSKEGQHADVIVWPEGTFPFLVLEEPELLFEFNKYIQNKTLVIGAPRRNIINGEERYLNSMAFIGGTPQGPRLLGLYDKGHLVPFGEYLPFKSVFNALGISSLVSYGTDFMAGSGPQALKIPNLPSIDPRICYEIIFPNYTNKTTINTDWIVNTSVDAWYGDLLGPDQHYNQARFRAIEQGKPLIRAASGGWSAIVDSFGRPVKEFRKGATLVESPLPLKLESTIYSCQKDIIFIVFLFSFYLTGILFDKKNVM